MTSMTEPTRQAPAMGLDAIEAALRDLWHQAGDATNSAGFRNPPFEKCGECDTALGELNEDAYLRYQRNAIKEAAKAIRQAVAEEIAQRIEPRDVDTFTRWDERAKVAEEIRAALIERSNGLPEQPGDWWDGWRGGLIDGADTAAVHGLPPEFREAMDTAFDQAVFGRGDGVPRGILSVLPVHDARVSAAPKDRLNRHFLPLFGAAAEGLEFADEERPRQGSEPPLIVSKLGMNPWESYPTPWVEPHVGTFLQQLADAEAADPERFRQLRLGQWPEKLTLPHTAREYPRPSLTPRILGAILPAAEENQPDQLGETKAPGT